MNKRKQACMAAILIPAIIIADQILKLWVKSHMQIGEEIPIFGSWFCLHFIENAGFAFGMNFGYSAGKVILTLIRIVGMAFFLWLLPRLIRKGHRTLLIFSLTLIIAGGVGNLIDSCFYGLIFNESFYNVATLFPPEGGYAPLFYGRVVDMFYFPLVSFDWPQWMPFIGGDHFVFFNAIFNIADSAITIGITLLIIDQLIIGQRKK